MVILGKSLSGGFLPVSAVLADDNVMMNIHPGDHGSTFGGNPLACAVGMKALQVTLDEKLVENSAKMGKIMKKELIKITKNMDFVKEVRGKGLFCAAEIYNTDKINAWDVTMKLMEYGILAKPTHETVIRLCPPLVINEK